MTGIPNQIQNFRPSAVRVSKQTWIFGIQPKLARNGKGVEGDQGEVEISTLDSDFRSGPCESVDAMKLGVEGAEELAFRGATEVLATAHPAVIFEANPEAATALGLSARGTGHSRRNGLRLLSSSRRQLTHPAKGSASVDA
jgi:hypothetical protein